MNTPSTSPEDNGSAPATLRGPFTNCTSSPVHVGRSLREFEEQMATLRKENFNLKLRIYFLEEKPSSSSNVPAEATQKQLIDLKVSCLLCNSIWCIEPRTASICHGRLGRMAQFWLEFNLFSLSLVTDLKVENESLRKELEEKQNLLCQASQAMEMMEGEHKKQSHESQMIIDDLNHRIESMTVSQSLRETASEREFTWFFYGGIFQHEMRNLEKALYACSKNNEVDFSEFLGAVSSKDIEAQRKVS